MIAPYRHIANLQDLSDDEITDHFNLVKKSLALLKEMLNPDGFNIGLNIGKVAGAGIEEHLHTHIVPRWQGDVNFMPVLSNTRVISEELAATYKKLRVAIE